MANNSFTPTFPEIWAPYVQKLLENILVGKAVANFRTQANLVVGDTVHIGRMTRPLVGDYTRGTNGTEQTVAATVESLTIDKERYVYQTLEDGDRKQSNINLEQEMIMNMTYELAQDMDATFLAQIANAGHTFDNSGSSYDLSSANIQDVLAASAATLRRSGVVGQKPLALVADPKTIAAIESKMITNGFNMADNTLKNGYRGKFLGYSIYESTNLPSTITLGMATVPTAGDTVVVNGVTFTYRAVPAVAGEVDIAGTAAVCVDNLVAAINGSGVAGASSYIEISTDDRRKLSRDNVVATDGTTSLTITASGYINASETLSDDDDVFGNQTISHYFGQVGGIDMAIQIAPSIEKMRKELRQADIFKIYDLYGVKVFTDGAEKFGKLQIIA